MKINNGMSEESYKDSHSIISKYDEDSTSCNYFNGFLYLMGNIKYILLFLLAKISLVKNEIFIAKN